MQTSTRSGVVRRKCACGGTPGPTGECAECRRQKMPNRVPASQQQRDRTTGDDREESHTSPRHAGGHTGTDSIASSIVNDVLRSSGRPIDTPTRQFMESRFGHDFSQVRVHTDERAAQSAAAVSAHAYTVGRNIVFGANQYSPATVAGRRLLAHELTHVVQQRGAAFLQRQPAKDVPTKGLPTKGSPPAPELEDEAKKTVAPIEDEDESKDALVAPETIDPFPDQIYISHDLAPEEEKLAAKAVGRAPASPLLIDPGHPTEREADAISHAVVSSAPGELSPIQHLAPGREPIIQRKFYWEDRNTLAWADFQGAVPKGSPFDAATATGYETPNLGVKREAHPESPILPDKCKVRGKDDVKYNATIGFDIVPYNVRAWMEESQSWVRPGKQSPGLKSHEQGHFDISNVIAEKIDWAVLLWDITHGESAVRCGKVPALNAATKAWNKHKPNKAIQKIYKQGSKLWKKAQKDYDDETGHGAKAAEQKAWEGQIGANLPNYVIQ